MRNFYAVAELLIRLCFCTPLWRINFIIHSMYSVLLLSNNYQATLSVESNWSMQLARYATVPSTLSVTAARRRSLGCKLASLFVTYTHVLLYVSQDAGLPTPPPRRKPNHAVVVPRAGALRPTNSISRRRASPSSSSISLAGPAQSLAMTFH